MAKACQVSGSAFRGLGFKGLGLGLDMNPEAYTMNLPGGSRIRIDNPNDNCMYNPLRGLRGLLSAVLIGYTYLFFFFFLGGGVPFR